MKAVLVTQFGGTEFLQYEDVEIPTIEMDEVLIRVVKTSVNFADIKSRYGKKGGKIPFIPGLDAAGYIEKIGSQVTSLKEGQRVIAFPKNGSYAQYVVASEKLVFPIPDELDFQTAAACPVVSFLSHRLLQNVARIQEGESVLVHAAAGGVGTTAIQLAKIMGAGKVIGTVGSKEKMKTAKESGADYVICYEEENFAEQVNEITNGNGVDIILDSVSGSVTENSLNCLAPYGRLVHFGNSSGADGNIKTVDLHSSCRAVLGFSLGTTRKLRPELLKETAQQVFPYLVNKQLEIKIGHEYSLCDAAKAHDLMEKRLNKGKIVLNVQ
ncbi:quinone oxidoreductase [Heyndrickxia shackletonii]|uniref:Quinone oxidoreductase n=1 Tax=Heyndrickxia shackletonii TaxID=157838 RepID=A0A0Q3WTV4_9BACI|nr:zinc-binding dehydrogenase [Heyndrickxia shackletonii]KQL51475.1 quinone oxidoreductase [Heyndrickxia shackletonii]NEZ02414.1 zinc-binding dehydrogenase [Heyndrickxia shackletonii]